MFALHAAPAHAKRRGGNDRYASIVIDAATGAVLSESNADKRLYPASLTKMMTLYLTFEAMKNGHLRRHQRMQVSPHAAVQEPSKLGLKPGATISVKDAILALVTKSANDVAVVLAETIAGSEARFGRMMTQKARQLGMNNTRFTNASGLHHPDQISTARDMAILSRALVYNYPEEYKYFSTANFKWAGATFRNHNGLMRTYHGMDGIKTGYVSKSGFNLAASAVRDNRRLVGVVFGGRTTHSRNAHMKTLLDNAFARIGQGEKIRIDIASAQTPQRKPKFDAMGLVMKDGPRDMPTEQGDAGEDLRLPVMKADFNPRPINTGQLDGAVAALPAIATQAGRPAGDWAVQVGAFSSHDAGLRALTQAQDRLPHAVSQGASPVIVPLMTNRGLIYRARLAGLSKDGAAGACRVLKGSCLILAVQ